LRAFGRVAAAGPRILFVAPLESVGIFAFGGVAQPMNTSRTGVIR
jgi:hypothetical protein